MMEVRFHGMMPAAADECEITSEDTLPGGSGLFRRRVILIEIHPSLGHGGVLGKFPCRAYGFFNGGRVGFGRLVGAAGLSGIVGGAAILTGGAVLVDAPAAVKSGLASSF